MGQFSNSFPKHFSYLCEYAIRCALSCSFCEYPFIFHCLHCSPSCFDPDSLLLAHFWLGLCWMDYISANKSFSSSKTSSRKPYTSSKQQERQKHSVEITINFSGSKRQTVSAYRQQPRAVHPGRRVQSYISRRASEDGHKEKDTDVKSAPEAPARPAPGEPGPGPSAVPSEPLHGPVDVAEDSLDGLQSAFRALSVEEVVTQPVKRKRDSEKDAGDEAEEGEDQGQDLTNDPTFEGAPSASRLHASPSPITTTLQIPDPAAATSTPITNPPMVEGTGFTGMPPYPAYGMGPPTTAFPEATTASEPVASSSAPRWYAAEYHHPLPATGTYVDVPGYAPGYATLSGLRRGPDSLGGRSRGSGRSSNRSLTRSEINEVLRGATSKIMGDLTQEIREKLEPLMIPPQASPTTVGMSPHQVQANHLAAGLTNTLGSLRSRPMPTPAAIPRSPFVPRTAQPPYSHVTNSTRAELDRLGLTALRAMVDVEPYGSSDLGGDPSDDEPPSMTSASPSEDDDPEDPENPRGKKKKKKKKTRRFEGRRSQEAKAIATSKIVVNLPEFTGKDLSEFAENFGRFLRLTGQTHASGRVKCDLLLQCCKTKYLEKQVRQIVTNSATFADVLVALERQYPTYETDLSIRAEIQNLPVLPNNPKSGRVSELLADLDHWAGRLTPGSYSSDDLLFWLIAKLPRELWDECRSTAERKARSLRYEDLCVLLLELALEKESDQQLNNYRPGGGGSGGHGQGYQGSRTGQGTTPKHAHARIMENVKELLWCVPETSRATCSTPLTASSETAS